MFAIAVASVAARETFGRTAVRAVVVDLRGDVAERTVPMRSVFAVVRAVVALRCDTVAARVRDDVCPIREAVVLFSRVLGCATSRRIPVRDSVAPVSANAP